MNRCTACGCFERVRPPDLFCSHHHKRLPEELRRELGAPHADVIHRAQAINDAIRYLNDNELRTFAHAV